MKSVNIIRVCLLSSTLTCCAFGQVYLIDQHYDDTTPPQLMENVVYWTPIGQEFTPTFDSLSFVDLFTDNFVGNGPGTPAVLSVEIRSGTIDGAVLGVSAPETLPPYFFGETVFTFASPLALESGSLYVIQIVQDSGDEFVGVISPNTSSYPGGQLIIQGAPEPDGDMWFSEGITIPEPTVVALLCAGASLILIREKRSVRG